MSDSASLPVKAKCMHWRSHCAALLWEKRSPWKGRRTQTWPLGTAQTCCGAEGGWAAYQEEALYVAEPLSVSRMFWSGPFQVMVGLGRPHTLHCSVTVSPSKQVTSTNGTRNSGATVVKST